MKHEFKTPQLQVQAGKSYLTANGMRVDIYEIKDNGAGAPCHGYLHRQTPSGRIKKDWNIWCKNGSFKFCWGNSGLDIVSEV